MTVCVAIKVNDCIVFAADSATSLSAVNGAGEQVILNVYENANKVFNLQKSLPICAMTAGMGNLGPTSISTLCKDLRKAFTDDNHDLFLDPKNDSIEEVAQKARNFLFEDVYKTRCPDQQGSLDFWVGGYSSGAELGEIWKVQINNGECPNPECRADHDSCTIEWGGQPEAINRLLLGYGQELPSALLEAGMTAEQAELMRDHIAVRSQANLMHAAMPTLDAIELADFLVETTKRYVKFMPGSNTVGGDSDIATVTKHEGFKWITRKHFYRRTVNPLETDHV